MATSNTYCLYRHVSPSGGIYVGITSLAPEVRWGHNGSRYRQYSDYPIARAISKYGWDAMKHEVIFSSISREKAQKFERHLISFYKMLGVSYNITEGGEAGNGNRSHLGQKASEETRRKMSISGGQVVYQYSKDGKFVKKWDSQKKASDKLNIKRGSISAASCGRIPSAGGYYWSPLPPDEWIMPKKRHVESGRKRKVYQFTTDGILIKSWESVTEMNKECGYSIAQIALACNYDGRAHGFLWSYSPQIELKKIEAQKSIASANRNKKQ